MQIYLCSGYCPFWEYSVGIRKPGLFEVAWLSAYRGQDSKLLLIVVISACDYLIMTGYRLPYVYYALITPFSSVALHFYIQSAIFYLFHISLPKLTKSLPKNPENRLKSFATWYQLANPYLKVWLQPTHNYAFTPPSPCSPIFHLLYGCHTPLVTN